MGRLQQDGVVDIQRRQLHAGRQLDAFLAGLTPNSLRGDADGDGEVQFSDFVILSGNFTNAGQYTDGDFDKDGEVQFSDFVILSGAFGTVGRSGRSRRAGASHWPIGSDGARLAWPPCGAARVRVSHCLAACLVLGLVASATNNSAMARDFDVHLMRLDPAGTNNQINDAREARRIERGSEPDVVIAEDVESTVTYIDFEGGAGQFPGGNAYPNGVNDESMDDFMVQVTGALEIPEGDWTIALNSDDGGYISMPRVTFSATGNENGAAGVPGELMFNGTRGQGTWTYGQLYCPGRPNSEDRIRGVDVRTRRRGLDGSRLRRRTRNGK